MKKQKFEIKKRIISRFFVLASFCILSVMSFNFLFPKGQDKSASAMISTELYGLTINADKSAEFSFDQSSIDNVSVTKATVETTTNSPSGYKLYISGKSEIDSDIFLNGTRANNQESRRYHAIDGTFDEPTILSSQDYSTWGYAIAGLHNFDNSYDTFGNNSKFAAMPTKGNEQLIHTHNGTAENSTLDVYYGAKASIYTEPGKYIGSVIYTALSEATDKIGGEAKVEPNALPYDYWYETIKIITSLNTDLPLTGLSATVDGKTCEELEVVDGETFTVECVVPEGLEIGKYDVELNIASIGKTYLVEDGLGIYYSMQDVTPEYCRSIPLEEQVRMIDVRTNKVYWVARLADGNCWMTQNLEIPNTDEYSHIRFYRNETDVDSSYSEYAYDFASEEYYWDGYVPSNSQYYPGLYYSHNYDYYWNNFSTGESCTKVDENCDAVIKKDKYDVEEDEHRKIGDHVNYNLAALQNMDNYFPEDPDETDQNQSICPGSWRLPSADVKSLNKQGDILALTNAYDNLYDSPFYAVPAGSISWKGSSAFQLGDFSTKATYLTSTKKTGDDVYTMSIDGDGKGSIGTTHFYLAGASVRCLLRGNDYTLTYNLNGGTGAKPNDQVVNTVKEQGEFNLAMGRFEKYGYRFLGWDEDASAETPTYAYDDLEKTFTPATFTTSNSESTLYAIWEMSDTPKAILGANHNLNFVYDSVDYIKGETYTDNLGETTIDEVFEIHDRIETYDAPWAEKHKDYVDFSGRDKNIYYDAINIDESFNEYHPISTSVWFQHPNMNYRRTFIEITNLQNLNMDSVEDASAMFCGQLIENEIDLSTWDTKNVLWMGSMFQFASFAATGMDSWDTSSVISMGLMFKYADIENIAGLGIENWDTSSVINMDQMFYDTHSSNDWVLDLSSWDVSNVTRFERMFYESDGGVNWIMDLSNWDLRSATSIQSMFAYSGRNSSTWKLITTGWNTASITDMSEVFWNSAQQDWSGGYWYLYGADDWNTSSVTNMSNMFHAAGSYATKWEVFGGLDDWDVENVVSMCGMFDYAGAKADSWSVGTLRDWDVSKVQSMSGMFSGAGREATNQWLLNLIDWDTSSVTDMSGMFSNSGRNASAWSIGDISGWNVANVVDMSGMFANTAHDSYSPWTVGDLGSWDVSSVVDMSEMFYGTAYSTDCWTVGDLGKWDVRNLEKASYMFGMAGYRAKTWSIGSLADWQTDSLKEMYGMFSYAGRSATTWTIGDLGNWNDSGVTDMGIYGYGHYSSASVGIFEGAGYVADDWYIGDLSKWDVSNVTNMNSMFREAGKNADEFNIGNIGTWNVGKVQDMEKMFYNAGAEANTWYIGDLGAWDVSNVKVMSNMFEKAGLYASKWDLGNLGNWKLQSITNMSYMFSFAGYSATEWNIGELDNWSFSNNPLTLNYTFDHAGFSDPDWTIGNLGNWDVGHVTSASGMFRGAGIHAENWNIGNIGSWNVSNIELMNEMFAYSGYYSNTWNIGDLDEWQITSLTNAEFMFDSAGYSATEWNIGDISGWDTKNVIAMYYMFNQAGKNAEYSLDLSGWDTSGVKGRRYNVYPLVLRTVTTDYSLLQVFTSGRVETTGHGHFADEVEDKITQPAWTD